MIGEAQRGDADCFGHANVGVGAEKTFDTCGDGGSRPFRFRDGGAEFRRKVRTEDDELQVDERVFGEAPRERPI